MRKLPKAIQEAVRYCYPGDKFVKRPKYRNRSCVCSAKHIHQSILEADYCSHLLILKKSGEIKDYFTQYPIEIIVNNRIITKHYVDFYVLKPNGAAEFHETKGYEQEVWKIKRRLCEALFPDTPYIVKYEKTRYFKK